MTVKKLKGKKKKSNARGGSELSDAFKTVLNRFRQERNESTEAQPSEEVAEVDLSPVEVEEAATTTTKRKATEKDLDRKREKTRQNRITKKKIKRGEIKLQSKKPKQAIDYLRLWYSSRDQWKFNKTLQVWLLQNAYSQEMMIDSDFDILVEYLASAQGKAKDETLQKANDKISQYEALEEAERGDEERLKTYERARRILQSV